MHRPVDTVQTHLGECLHRYQAYLGRSATFVSSSAESALSGGKYN
ncbi:hypothetical protein [Bosea sp. AS-1]|nr:hypothetical protein [Bosea sp. AS-1]